MPARDAASADCAGCGGCPPVDGGGPAGARLVASTVLGLVLPTGLLVVAIAAIDRAAWLVAVAAGAVALGLGLGIGRGGRRSAEAPT